jgi:choline/glycine/proline betaine transport protein
VRDAYVWSFTHWGLAAWASYAIVGLSLAFFAYRRNLPLTIRSALTPIFGKRLSGPIGHVVDIVAVVATVLGVRRRSASGWSSSSPACRGSASATGSTPPTADGGQFVDRGHRRRAVVIMGASTLSALSGVGKGIKWLSNINMGLSFFMLLFFLVFGSTFFGLRRCSWASSTTSSRSRRTSSPSGPPDGVEGSEPPRDALAGWQGGWTDLLLGLVDRLRALRGRVPRAHLQGPDDPRIRAGRADHPVDHVLRLVRDRRRHGHRSGTVGRGRGRDQGAGASDQLFAMLAVILTRTWPG